MRDAIGNGLAALLLLAACGTEHTSPRDEATAPDQAPVLQSDAQVPDLSSTPGTHGPSVSSGGPATSAHSCDADPELQIEGCPCGEVASGACWSGPPALRHVGDCHDGTHECLSSGGSEFSSWGPCVGEQHDCGQPDAGPPPPPPPGDCPCVPGAVIACDEDCTAGIICSISAEKSCLPDGTWGPCHETGNAIATITQVDLSNFGATLNQAINQATGALGGRCRSVFHGCSDALGTNALGLGGETFSGDCSKEFTCGHAPSASQ